MQKIELTPSEALALSAIVERELQYAFRIRTAARVDLREEAAASEDDYANLEYWTERMRMLRSIKHKLERGEDLYDA